MADVAIPLVVAPPATDDNDNPSMVFAAPKTQLQVIPDACDVVDAADLVDEDFINSKEQQQDADFDAFGSARTLQGETVGHAQEAAAAANLDSNSTSMTQTNASYFSTTHTNTDSSSTNLVVSGDSTGQEEDAEAIRKKKSRFVTPKDFELLKVIGMGAFGKVLQVKNRQSSQILAMKVISKRLLKRKAGYIENIHAERNILTRVHHPFVVTMHCSFQTKEKLFIIMDFLAGGELFLRLGKEGIFLEKDAAFYLAEIILALDHLHSLGIIHRDLKPENVLLSSDGHICLTDFGLAKDFGPDWNSEDENQGRASTICGTQEYMAPEMVAKKGYGKAADYWSLGCIAYEMLNGLPPFSNKEGSKELFRKIMSEKVKMPPGCSASACKLLKGLLNRNPDQRLGSVRSTMFEVGGVSGLKQAAFFSKIDWGKLEVKELKPPYDLTVDNELDLRNFHNEFTNMPLPRSVKEMSDMDDLPRRVYSQAFRGFSFIQPSFSLPERNSTDVENYWNQVDEDGESDSDIASSKCGGETNEQQQTEQPEKKKRPPRKRKKKKQDAADVALSVSSRSPAPSEQGAESEIKAAVTSESTPLTLQSKEMVVSATETSASDKTPLPCQATPTNSLGTIPTSSISPVSSVQGNLFQNVASASSKTPEVPKKATPLTQTTPRVEQWQAISSAGAVKNRVQNTQRAINTGVSEAKKATPQRSIVQQSTNRSGWSNPAAAKPQSVAAPPGSWAARIQQTPNTYSSTPSTIAKSGTPWSKTKGTTPQAPPPPPPPAFMPRASFSSSQEQPSPSSDWRQHASPIVQRALNRSTPNSTPGMQAPTLKAVPNWPSLNDFPPPPSGGPTSLSSSKKQPPAGLKGAWASRAKR